MSYLSFRFGRFNLLAQSGIENHTFRVTREGAGEVIVDMSFISLTFMNHRKVTRLQGLGVSHIASLKTP